MRSTINICVGILVVLILTGCTPPPTPVHQPVPAPKPTVTAEQSWKVLVADIRTECNRHAGCSLDYEKLHNYDDRCFGMTVIGYKDSEYYLNLYQFNPKSTAKSNTWMDSRPSSPEGPYDDAYFSATSKRWSVPEATIRQWFDEAHRTVKEIYSKRQ